MKRIKAILGKKEIERLKVGDQVFISGVIYTARDQAHRRMLDALKRRQKLPVELQGKIIYYCGPTKTPKGKTIGSCGPTTGSRMDEFTPALLKAGLKGMIGKGRRSQDIAKAIKKYKGVYFLTYAGCGALLSKYVQKARAVAYKDLGPEAIYALKVKDFPLIVGIDTRGNDIYKKARR